MSVTSFRHTKPHHKQFAATNVNGFAQCDTLATIGCLPKKSKSMSLQNLFDRQGEIVNNYIIEYKEQYAHEQYCPYCVNPKGKKFVCCGEMDWVDFKDLDDDTQLEIIKEEYDNAFKNHKV
jgi:hypothetical protein